MLEGFKSGFKELLCPKNVDREEEEEANRFEDALQLISSRAETQWVGY